MTDPPTSRLAKWRFFHIVKRWATAGFAFGKNLTLEQALQGHVCPFIEGSAYPTDQEEIFNPGALLRLSVYGTDRPITKDWPPTKEKDGFLKDFEVETYLDNNGHVCSSEAFAAAVVLVDSGAYESARRTVWAGTVQNFVFMISVMDDPEVDNTYNSIIKPRLAAKGFTVARADEMRHATLITTAIADGIARSRFVVADLTKARPNCYYELGYAHALGKPGILVAKAGTEKHFDVSGYRWNFWKPEQDFGTDFEAAIEGVLTQLRDAKPARRGPP